MEPALYDIKFTQGDDYNLRIAFQDDNGQPLDYSDMTFTAQVRPTYKSPEAKDFTVDDTDSDTGIVLLALADADTEKMPVSNVWDLQMETSGGEKLTVIAGDVIVRPQSTRA